MIAKIIYSKLLRLPRFPGKSTIEELLRSAFLQPMRSRVYGGLWMQLDPLEWTQIDLLAGCTPEPETLRLLERLVAPGDVYVDVGAHVGLHTLVVRRKIGPRGRVIAVEPQPYNCERLLSNWQLNGFENLMVYVAAAGSNEGFVHLHHQSVRDKARLSLTLDTPNDLPQIFCVPVVRLERILSENGNPAVKLLKIDAEGFEAHVLAGLSGAHSRVENIVIELLGQNQTQRSKSAEAIETLRSWGLHLYDMRGKPYRAGMALIESNLWATRKSP